MLHKFSLYTHLTLGCLQQKQKHNIMSKCFNISMSGMIYKIPGDENTPRGWPIRFGGGGVKDLTQ